MMIDRRTFVAGAGVVVLTPSLGLFPTQLSVPEKAAKRVVVMIEGWSMPDNDADDAVLLRIRQSWRTAWR